MKIEDCGKNIAAMIDKKPENNQQYNSKYISSV